MFKIVQFQPPKLRPRIGKLNVVPRRLREHASRCRSIIGNSIEVSYSGIKWRGGQGSIQELPHHIGSVILDPSQSHGMFHHFRLRKYSTKYITFRRHRTRNNTPLTGFDCEACHASYLYRANSLPICKVHLCYHSFFLLVMHLKQLYTPSFEESKVCVNTELRNLSLPTKIFSVTV